MPSTLSTLLSALSPLPYLPQFEACLKHKSCTVCQCSVQPKSCVQGDTCNVFICTAKWAEQGRREGGVRVSLWTGEAVAPSTPCRCDPDSKNTNTKQAIKQSQKCLNVFYINLILFHFPFKCRWNTRGDRRRRRGAAICNLRGGKKLLANENSLHCTQVCFNNKARWGRTLSLTLFLSLSFALSLSPSPPATTQFN